MTTQTLENIKGSRYLESADVKTVILPKDTPHTVILTAYESGSFTFESSVLLGNTESSRTSFEAIHTSTTTKALLVNPGTSVGTTTPLAVDFDGNGTVDKSITTQTGQTSVYDTVPPELRLTFSTSTKDVILSAADNLDPNPSIVMGTSTITLKDSQNNQTVINFTKFKDAATKLVFTYNTISRNGIATTTPTTSITYDWKLDPNNQLKDLDTKVFIKGIERNTFNYKKNNTPTIKVKDIQTGNISTTTQTGFVPVTVTTRSNTDLLDISY